MIFPESGSTSIARKHYRLYLIEILTKHQSASPLINTPLHLFLVMLFCCCWTPLFILRAYNIRVSFSSERGCLSSNKSCARDTGDVRFSFCRFFFYKHITTSLSACHESSAIIGIHHNKNSFSPPRWLWIALLRYRFFTFSYRDHYSRSYIITPFHTRLPLGKSIVIKTRSDRVCKYNIKF